MSISFEEAFAQTGHESKTTFWMDFSIADRFGLEAVEDTFRRSKYWISNPEYWSELVVVLNWKTWQHEEEEDFCELYSKLFDKATEMFYSYYKNDDAAKQIFFEITD